MPTSPGPALVKQNCFSLRPGTILGYQGEAWKVTRNDTLRQRFTIELIRRPAVTKTLHYMAGQEVTIRWKPDERR